MQAVRTPVLGIALAVLLLVGETIGMRTYVGLARPVTSAARADTVRRQLDQLTAELDQLEARIRILSLDLARLRSH